MEATRAVSELVDLVLEAFDSGGGLDPDVVRVAVGADVVRGGVEFIEGTAI
jgi:hypothetical protein